MNGRTTDQMVEQAMKRLDKKGTGDSYTPTFITVNPDGTISYEFDGVIHAQGLDLDLATAAPQDINRIRWMLAGNPEIMLTGLRTLGSGINTLNAKVNDPGGGQHANLTIQEDAVAVSYENGGPSASILNLDGTSAFLKLAAGGDVSLAFGTDTFTWAASNTSNVRTINHGLGKVPAIVIGSVDFRVNTGLIFHVVQGSRTNTQFQAQGWSTGALSDSRLFYWVAIG